MITNEQIARQYESEPWYRAVREVIACLSTSKTTSSRKKITTTTYRRLTEAEKQEVYLFILQHVGGNRETAQAVFVHCMEIAGAPTSPVVATVGTLIGAGGVCYAFCSPEFSWILLAFGALILFGGIVCFRSLLTEFPHKRLIQARSRQQGGMLRLLGEMTRAM